MHSPEVWRSNSQTEPTDQNINPWDQTVCSQPSTAKSQEALAQSAGKSLNDLGNVQPAADSSSVDASLLLNCRATAENGSCSQSKRRRVA